MCFHLFRLEGKIVWFCGNFTFIARSLSLFCTKLSFSTSFLFRQSSTFLVFYVFMFKALCSIIHFFLLLPNFSKKKKPTPLKAGLAALFRSFFKANRFQAGARGTCHSKCGKTFTFPSSSDGDGVHLFFFVFSGAGPCCWIDANFWEAEKKSEKAKKCEG